MIYTTVILLVKGVHKDSVVWGSEGEEEAGSYFNYLSGGGGRWRWNRCVEVKRAISITCMCFYDIYKCVMEMCE